LRRRLVAVARPHASPHPKIRALDAPSQADKSARGGSGDKSPALQALAREMSCVEKQSLRA